MRKIEKSYRIFNEDWIRRYFFLNSRNKAVCLLCQETVVVFKGIIWNDTTKQNMVNLLVKCPRKSEGKNLQSMWKS